MLVNSADARRDLYNQGNHWLDFEPGHSTFSMPDCPKCHQPIESQAIACPHCRMPLKAHGHPGMTLYRAAGQEPLCSTCVYHDDDTCNFPKRPTAMDCTLYRDRAQPVPSTSGYSTGFQLKTWFKRHQVWFWLFGLLVLSLVIVLSK